MTYLEKYNRLKSIFNNQSPLIKDSIAGIDIINIMFSSENWDLLPGSDKYICKKHGTEFIETLRQREPALYDLYPDVLKHEDFNIEENRNFYYTLFRKSKEEKSDGVIFLFHGLNEKYWDKYLPWAEKLVELTGKAVILFPIAFHMNRSPAEWSHNRLMNNVAQIRQKYSDSIVNTTFANAAISARIQSIPQRYFWSGLQTFFDAEQLIGIIKSGKHPYINPDASIDLFSYSVGSFLSEILIMTNHKGYFDNTRLFIFCGGPTLDRMLPNSKYILDSDATISLYSYYTERIETEIKKDKRVAHYLTGDHAAGKYFKSMLSYHKDLSVRQERLKEIHNRIYAIALKNDAVIPPNEVRNTLQGEDRDIPIRVDVKHFPFPYDHVTPFSPMPKYEAEVNAAFNEVFSTAAEFLK